MATENSIFSDLSGYVDRVTKLARLDAALLTLETKQNLQSVAVSIGLLAGAIAIAFLGLIILLVAAVLLLIQLGMAPSLAALTVAIALFAISGILAFTGIERLKVWSLTPRRTLAQFTNNIQALRMSLRNETNS
jgi:hypothetical protein